MNRKAFSVQLENVSLAWFDLVVYKFLPSTMSGTGEKAYCGSGWWSHVWLQIYSDFCSYQRTAFSIFSFSFTSLFLGPSKDSQQWELQSRCPVSVINLRRTTPLAKTEGH